MKVNIQDYDYFMFVDASGCDGTKFDSGSSSCYAVAGYLVAKEFLQEDLQTLCDIRKIISGDPGRELKYSTLRRHKNRAAAFAQFKRFHGHALGRVAFKKILVARDEYNTSGKIFSVLMHAITISFLESYSEVAGKKVLIVVDRMKNTEEIPVQYLASGSMHNNLTEVKNYDLIFRDSKDKDFQLIQVADFISGILRDYFEQYESNSVMIEFWRRCPLCLNTRYRHLCGKRGRKNREALIDSSNFKHIRGFFPCSQLSRFIRCLTFMPSDIFENLHYLFCFKI